MPLTIPLLTCVILTGVAISLSSSSVTAQVPDQEMNTLFELYQSTKGISWRWRFELRNGPRWNFTRDGDGNFIHNPCSSGWQGVNCSYSSQLCSVQTCQITELTLSAYNLTGSIPSEIGNLSMLKRLDLAHNELTGSIPIEIGNLILLDVLTLARNTLIGSIPSTIGNLLVLTMLDFDNNNLTGSIPSVIGNLLVLEWLDLDNNALSGTISSEIGNLVVLEWLDLSDNALIGTIPSEIGNLVVLEIFDLDFNVLTGTIPSEISNLVALESLDLDNNALTGSIPGEISNLVVLEFLDLDKNALTGTIPSEICNLFVLESLDLEFNALTGFIPSELSNLQKLQVLYLEFNELTGSIPSEIGNLVFLEWLDLSDNALTGSIPREVGNLVVLGVFDLEYNELIGSIPSKIGSLVLLEFLSLSENALTGSIPSELGNLENLQSIFLQANSFTGSIDHVFNASVQKTLEVIDLSDNLLSGHSLDSIFLLSEIKVLALSVNCFQEALPISMCQAATIEVLSLNGLGAAQGCKNIVKFPISNVALFNTIGGTLPECVWHLRNLTILHLSGNGLTGEITSQLPDYSRIEDLSLSYNKFSGTVSLYMQKVQRVDLSHNKFSGKYDDYAELWTNTLLDLEINRLSGRLPVSKLENISDLNILRGNMFSCESIPENDEFVTDYICGSEDLNESLYVFASVFSIACSIALVAYLAVVTARKSFKPTGIISFSCVHEQMTRLHLYMTSVEKLKSTNSSLEHIIALRDKCKSATWFCVQLLIVMLVINAPIYIVRGSDGDEASSTHTNTYSWFWTLAYLRGVVPSTLILISWVVTVAACFCRIIVFPLRTPVKSRSLSLSGSLSIDESMKNKAYYYGWVAGVLLINVMVAITVNTLYIYSTQQPLSPLIRLGLQLSLAVFRLVYAYCALPFLSRSIADSVANISFRLQLLMVNNLIIPCLVTAFASPSCFQGLILEADDVSTPYSYEACDLFFVNSVSTVCLTWIQVEVESAPLIPPFVYNNQCASVLLTSYIPVLIFGFSIQIMSCIVMPLVLSRLGKWLNLPELIHHKVVKGIMWPEFWMNSHDDDSDLANRNEVGLEKDPTIVLNVKSTLCFDILNNLMIMLTFGLCSPILAFAATCTVVTKMHVLILLVGRFTYVLRSVDNDNTKGVHFALAALGKIHFPLTEVLKQSFWVIVWTSALFFSFVCWDIAGDEVGWSESIWIPTVTIIYPLLLWLIAIGIKHRFTLFRRRDDCEEEKMGNTKDTDLELTQLPPLDDATITGTGVTIIDNPIHIHTG